MSLLVPDSATGDSLLTEQGLTHAVLGTVITELREIFRNRAIDCPPLSAETVLDAATLGLESLDFAELVVRLEQALGKDPFAQGEVPEIRTIHDLALVYL
jgi:acyl carrier protein